MIQPSHSVYLLNIYKTLIQISILNEMKMHSSVYSNIISNSQKLKINEVPIGWAKDEENVVYKHIFIDIYIHCVNACLYT